MNWINQLNRDTTGKAVGIDIPGQMVPRSILGMTAA